jgi:hypothetical protein
MSQLMMIPLIQSYPYNGPGDPDHRITEHDVHARLGNSLSERAYRYRTLFSTALDQKAIHAICTAARFSMPLGNNRFKAPIEAALGGLYSSLSSKRPFHAKQKCRNHRAEPGRIVIVEILV